MSNETMDIGTVDTEQLADACVSVWHTQMLNRRF
jgi:hypothetical protein